MEVGGRQYRGRDADAAGEMRFEQWQGTAARTKVEGTGSHFAAIRRARSTSDREMVKFKFEWERVGSRRGRRHVTLRACLCLGN